MVVVVCKFELICKISKMAQSRICLNVATLLDENLKLRKNLQGWFRQKLFTLMRSWMRCKELRLFGLEIS
jgi:hypothetical protein